MADKLRIKTRKIPVPFNGPDSSADLKAFMDNVFFDLSALSTQAYDLQTQLNYINQVRMSEMLSAAEAQNHIPRLVDALNDFKAQAGQPVNSEIDYCIDFSADNEVSFVCMGDLFHSDFLWSGHPNGVWEEPDSVSR